MTATLRHELETAGGHISLHADRLVIGAPHGAVPPELVERLRAAKPAIVEHLQGHCAHCGGPGWPSPLLPLDAADEGRHWVHDRCYPGWLAARRAGRPR